MGSTDRNSFGLYIHIPFCRSKCRYCDFNSQAGVEELVPAYFDALTREVLQCGDAAERTVTSVFIGGGTPSLPPAGLLADVLDTVRRRFRLSHDCEISMEANPGTLCGAKLDTYRSAGVNRLSIGLQTVQERLLRMLGRIHDYRQFLDSYEAARKADFTNINIDLIFGLPGQTPGEWEETLETVAALRPEHISAYSLKIEEDTELFRMVGRGELEVLDEELDRRMYHRAVEYLKACGYRHYEISNFARSGFECRHNLLYWRSGEYIGLGAGAHSHFKGVRYHRPSDMVRYIEAAKEGCFPVEDPETVDAEGRMSEYMFLGLRLVEGVDIQEFERRFGVRFREKFGRSADDLVRRGLLAREGSRLHLTSFGLDLANLVFMEFV